MYCGQTESKFQSTHVTLTESDLKRNSHVSMQHDGEAAKFGREPLSSFRSICEVAEFVCGGEYGDSINNGIFS